MLHWVSVNNDRTACGLRGSGAEFSAVLPGFYRQLCRLTKLDTDILRAKPHSPPEHPLGRPSGSCRRRLQASGHSHQPTAIAMSQVWDPALVQFGANAGRRCPEYRQIARVRKST
jgi:hypothetical protein